MSKPTSSEDGPRRSACRRGSLRLANCCGAHADYIGLRASAVSVTGAELSHHRRGQLVGVELATIGKLQNPDRDELDNGRRPRVARGNGFVDRCVYTADTESAPVKNIVID
jgi:hypothetical protein